MAAFTTWSALKTQLENDMASRDFTRRKYELSNSLGGHSHEFTDLEQLRGFYDWVSMMALKEANPTWTGRTYAKNGGRGL